MGIDASVTRSGRRWSKGDGGVGGGGGCELRWTSVAGGWRRVRVVPDVANVVIGFVAVCPMGLGLFRQLPWAWEEWICDPFGERWTVIHPKIGDASLRVLCMLQWRPLVCRARTEPCAFDMSLIPAQTQRSNKHHAFPSAEKAGNVVQTIHESRCHHCSGRYQRQ